MVNWITLPGLSPYLPTIEQMEHKVKEVIDGISDETIYLLEHEDVYTAGSSYQQDVFENLQNHNNIIYTGRGGKLTYHGEGQRVIYPILNLALSGRKKDIKLYVRNLEQWIINSLNEIGVKAYTIKDKVGIWIKLNDKDAKIASIGIRIKKWVTYHGVAVNISTDLTKFNAIIACGIKNVLITSLFQLRINITVGEFDDILKKQFAKIF